MMQVPLFTADSNKKEEKRVTKKQIMRFIAFSLCVCIMLTALCEVFELSDNLSYTKALNTYRDLPEDTVDAVWVGTSGVHRYWIPSQAYEDYGITVYPFSVNAMPTWLFTNAIDEVYAYQNPELIIIDVRAYAQNNKKKKAMEVRARRLIDSMEFFSLNRVKTALKTAKTINSLSEKGTSLGLSYLLPVIKYHSKWADEDFELKNNFADLKHEYLGFQVAYPSTIRKSPQKNKVYNSEVLSDLDPIAEESLYELLDYIEEKDLNVIFVDTPKFKKEYEMGRANTVYKILEERGIKYINYSDTDQDGNMNEDFGFDYKNDFMDNSHTNYYGAEKFTKVFAKHLYENYDLPDRRNDEKVKADWDGVYQKLKNQIKELESQSQNKSK